MALSATAVTHLLITVAAVQHRAGIKPTLSALTHSAANALRLVLVGKQATNAAVLLNARASDGGGHQTAHCVNGYGAVSVALSKHMLRFPRRHGSPLR